MKIKFMRFFLMTAMGIIIFLTLAVSCWATVVKKTEPQVRQTAPKSPVAKSSLSKRSLRSKIMIRGTLSIIGKRIKLSLNRGVNKVEVFSGHKKLKILGAGRSFDVTPYVLKKPAKGLTFYYYLNKNQKSKQIISPGEIKNLFQKIQRVNRKPEPLRPPRPASVDKNKATSQSVFPPSGVQALSKTAQPYTTTDIPKINKAPAAIRITRPVQGDYMVEGGQFILQWTGFGNLQEHCVNIYLRKTMRSEHNITIAENVCVNGYQWQLPQGVFGTGFIIQIKTIDNLLENKSSPFSILSSKPDLRVSSLNIQPANPDMRDDITVTGVIQNSGNGTANSSKATVKLNSGSWTSNVEVVNIPTLVFGPNAHQPFSVTFPPPYSSPQGNRPTSLSITARITADIQFQVTEADEGNNQRQSTFSIAPLANLIPQIGNEVETGMSKRVKINFSVKNLSSEPVDPTVCRTWIEKKGHENHNVPALGPEEVYSFHRSVFFASAGWRNYSLKVDYGNNISEMDENDNVKTGRIHARGLPPEDEANFPVARSFLEYLKWW